MDKGLGQYVWYGSTAGNLLGMFGNMAKDRGVRRPWANCSHVMLLPYPTADCSVHFKINWFIRYPRVGVLPAGVGVLPTFGVKRTFWGKNDNVVLFLKYRIFYQENHCISRIRRDFVLKQCQKFHSLVIKIWASVLRVGVLPHVTLRNQSSAFREETGLYFLNNCWLKDMKIFGRFLTK